MKKHLMKCFALAFMAGALAQTANAADLLVGGDVSPENSSYLHYSSDSVFWIGKYNLKEDESAEDHFQDAEPLEVEYEIIDPWGDEDFTGHGFSSNGIVRAKGYTMARISEDNFKEGDCIYIVEVLSRQFPDCIEEFDLAFDEYSDDLGEGYYDEDHLHGGKYWIVENIVDTDLGELFADDGCVACYVRYVGLDTDPLWQCRIGDQNYETLKEALDESEDGDTIYLKRDVDLTNTVFSADVTINKNVTITTENGGQVAIRRLGDYSIDIAANVTFTNVIVNGLSYAATKPMFDVANGATLTLAADTRVNSCVNASGDGGAIRSSGTVVIDGARVITSSTVGKGGAIYADGGTVDARGGEITGCSAAQGGGAVYLANGAELKLSGAFHAMGNTAGDAANNVEPTGAAQIVVPGAFTGSVGVTYPAAGVSARDGVQFGLVQGGGQRRKQVPVRCGAGPLQRRHRVRRPTRLEGEELGQARAGGDGGDRSRKHLRHGRREEDCWQ